MRILYLFMFPLYGNGSASFLRELSKELTKKGHEIAIVAPDKRKLENVRHYEVKIPQHGVFVGHPELPNAKKFKDMSGKEIGDIFTAYLTTSIEAVNDFNPHIIHVFHTAFLPPIARILKLLFGMRIIITTHGSDLTYLAQDRRLNGLINDANRVSVQITANSIFTQKAYLEMFGKGLKKKVKVIHGGVRLPNGEVDEKAIEAVNRKYKLKGKKIVLFTGRFIKGKGIEYLIHAAKYIDGTVVLVGDGPEKANYEEMVARKHLTNVIFTGYVSTSDKEHRLQALYKRADVFVTPTVWEGFGLTILEAMAAHTPVVASNQGGIVSIIKNGVNGLLITPRKSKAIAEAVNSLLENDELRRKIGDNAYQTVVDNFTWEKIAEKYEALYQKHAITTKEYLKLVQGETPEAQKISKMLNRLTPTNRP